MKVILFDIDRTLVHDGNAGKIALIQSFRKMFGIDNDFGIMAGRTDSSILRDALYINNIKEEKSSIMDFKDCYHKMLAKNIKEDLPGKRIYSGINPLLEELNKNKDIKMGLLTGNWEKGAYIKLAHFGLEKYFGFGAFGDDALLRNDLLPYALKRCGGCTKPDSKDVIVIGDTPSDIECALAHDCRSLGVATGRFSTGELIQKGADLAVDDLAGTEDIITWLFSGTKQILDEAVSLNKKEKN